ncbi:MAG TPA: MarR family transcriptional regulator [Gaiellales bacterium]|jgi:DNA-binding MarR family transcriptional regulator
MTEEIASRMRAVIGRLGRGLRQTRAGTDLSPSQYEVLASVSFRERVRMSDLAALEGLNPTLLSRIVGHLEEAELVTREADTTDRRVAHVVVTDKGRDMHDRIRGERTDVLAIALDGLDEEEVAALTNALPVLESLAKTIRGRSL